MSGAPPFVSVVIPTYDQVAGLARCLPPLLRQSYPADRYEVLVVDNDSREDVRGALAAFPRVRLLREPRPGSYAARNRGLAEARGEVLAFLDSDCVPDEAWVARGVARLAAHPRCGFVCGRVVLTFHDPDAPSAAELYDALIMNFHQDRHVADRWGGVGNLFAPRAVFERVGPFDARYKSGGDVEWGRRVHAHGYEQVYAEELAVTHPARRDLTETWKRAARVMGGRYQLRRAAGTAPVRLLLDLLRAWTPAVPFWVRLLGDRRLPRMGQRIRVLGVAIGAKYVGAWELTRLMLGAEPHRG